MNNTHSVPLGSNQLPQPPVSPDWTSTVRVIPSILLYLIPLVLILSVNPFFFSTSSHLKSRNVPKHWQAYHLPIIGSSIAYFSKRKDMILEGRDTVPGRYFSFFVGSKHVVALSGLQGRQAFFDNRNLNLAQGSVELLMGKPPSLKNPDDYGLTYLVRPLSALLQSHELSKRVPNICKDVDVFTKNLLVQPVSKSNPQWRTTDIYTTFPHLAFQLMHRAVGFTEIADSPSMIRKTRNFYHRFEKNTSSAHIIFPWLITPSYLIQGVLAGRMWLDMYRLLSARRLAQARSQALVPEKEGSKYDDAIQLLMNKGNSNFEIMQFIFFLFISGLGTTSFGVSWMIILLARYPEWQAKAREEVQRAIQRHRTNAQQSRNEILATLTLQQLESNTEFPILSACLKEGLRILLPGAMFRKNISGKEIPIDGATNDEKAGGQIIRAESYAVYSVADTHMDNEIYPDAEKYDPSRWLDDDDSRRGGQQPHTYLAWGSGRHACAGQRLARLLVYITAAHMLVNFDFELSDQDGGPKTDGALPPWSTNSHRLEVDDRPIYLRYKPRD